MINITFQILRPWLCAALLVFGSVALGATFASAQDQEPAEGKVTYDDHVRPILRNRCFSCHNQDQAKSDLAIDTFAGLAKGGASGEVIAAGDLQASRLWLLVNHEEEPKMPPEQDKLPAAELAVIKNWILGGALENSGSNVKPARPAALGLNTSGGSVRPEGPPPMPGPLPKGAVVAIPRPGAVTALAASPWAPLIALASPKQVILYHSDTAELLGVLPFPEGTPHVLRFSRNGKLLLAGGGRAGLSGGVVVFDVATGQRVFEVGDELDVVAAADINENHSLIALGGPRRVVRVYSTQTGEQVHEIKKHTDWIYAVEFSPDGVLLATADRSGGLFVWESETAREYLNLRGHTGPVTAVSWRADSNLLASGSEDGTIRLWEQENGGQVKGWGAHGGVAALHFTHDGRLVSAGRDRTLRLWDQNGQQLLALEAFGDLALEAAFTHDGKRVVGGDWTGEIRLWEAADGKRVANLATNPPTLAMLSQAAAKAAAEAEAAAQAAAAELAAAEKAATEQAVALKAGTDLVATTKAALAKAEEEKQLAAKDAAEKAKSAETLAAELAAMTAQLEKLAAEKAALEKLLAEKIAAAKTTADAAGKAKTAADAGAAARLAAEQALKAKNALGSAAAAAVDAAQHALAKAMAAKDAADKLLAEKATLAKTAAEKAAAARAAAEKAARRPKPRKPSSLPGDRHRAGTTILRRAGHAPAPRQALGRFCYANSGCINNRVVRNRAPLEP